MNEYELAGATLLRSERVLVVHERAASTGVSYGDGRIEAPRARGPISFGTLAHEVGHEVCDHARTREPRWVQEVEAWEYALAQVERFGLKGYERVHVDAARCLAHSFAKAIKRGVDPEKIRERYPTWWADALAHERWPMIERAIARRSSR
jgi:hypothetical protein